MMHIGRLKGSLKKKNKTNQKANVEFYNPFTLLKGTTKLLRYRSILIHNICIDII